MMHDHNPPHTLAALQRAALAALLLSALACTGPGIDPEPDIPEHVEYDTVRIRYDDAAPQPEGMATHQQPLVGDRSFLAHFARENIKLSNALLFMALSQVDTIASYPHTHYADNVWTWETSEAGDNKDEYLRFHMRLRPVEEGVTAISAHDFSLHIGPSKDRARKIMDGSFADFSRKEGVQQGVGVLRLFLDELHALGKSESRGQMRIAFRSNNRIRQVRTGFFRVQFDETAMPLSAVYEYAQLRDMGGELRYFGRGDYSDDGPPYELLSAHARWTHDLSGRVAARLSGGSLAENEHIVRQCWDPMQVVTWMNVLPFTPGANGGRIADCAEPLRNITLSIPEYTPTAEPTDPGIPDPHPSE